MYRNVFRFLFVLLFIPYALAQQHFGEIGDMELKSGRILKNVKVGYRTFGSPDSSYSNVVLYPTWFGGTSANLAGLCAKGKIIDSTKYYVIALDALGNGISTSPSNSAEQEGENFPEITIEDMVKSQYILLTQILGIKKVYAIVGGSMGSMQALAWSVLYPDFMQKVVPYVCTPRLTSYDLLWMNFALHIIETGKKKEWTSREIQKCLNSISALLGRTPEYVISKNPPEEFEKYFNSLDTEPSVTFTIDNYRAQLKAMIAFNLPALFDGSYEKLARSIKAKLLLIYSETDLLIRPETTKELNKYLGAQTLVLSNNCGHIAPGCEMEKTSSAIDEFLKK